MSDELSVTVSGLNVYPIKSCAGVSVREALLIETGLEFDRAWMVVDERSEAQTDDATISREMHASERGLGDGFAFAV